MELRNAVVLYRLPPIDFWSGWTHEDHVEFYEMFEEDRPTLGVDRQVYHRFKARALELARDLGWEGDTRHGFYVSGFPDLHSTGTCVLLGWKQNHEGRSFLASPFALTYLEGHCDAKKTGYFLLSEV